ncbi:MAG: uracil phosphoribosyltransferase [Acidimicrobiaceae bacterium]|jgi:uracil phosphoribosyltransferase|nr:uracil phosphoribosyltransferase [Acidimicrobiaceae bacterium]MBT6445675.1 uracil phosphoribosyltransferase [Acidimicrobiaceae bacterium]
MTEIDPSRLIAVDHSLVQHKLTLMRDVGTPAPLFRQLLRETATLLAYEALNNLPTTTVTVETPLGPAEGQQLETDPALISILRAGNGLLDGFLDIVPSASVGFIGMYRDHETLEAIEYYTNIPEALADRVTIAVDPMLATAGTAIAAIKKLRDAGAGDLRLVCLVAAPEGIARVHAADPDVMIITAAVDQGLNDVGYIVPGLGDAGDRIYGTQ